MNHPIPPKRPDLMNFHVVAEKNKEAETIYKYLHSDSERKNW